MPRTEALVIVAALVVAGGVLIQAISAPGPEPTAVEVPVAAAPPTPSETEVVVTVTTPTAEVSGVPDSVGAVLAGAGHAEFVGVDELLADLPASVVATLIEADVTLRVAEPAP